MKNYGKQLYFERKSRQITQVELSKATGLTQQTISNYEKGITNPILENIERIADVYGITIDELIGREPPKAPALISYTNSTHNGNNYIK